MIGANAMPPGCRARGGRTLAFNDRGTFAAYNRLERELTAAGFAVGSIQRGAPLGLMFGDYVVMKWRNLDADERSELHGVVEGDCREGPLLVTVFDDAPRSAREAISQLFADRLRAAYNDNAATLSPIHVDGEKA